MRQSIKTCKAYLLYMLFGLSLTPLKGSATNWITTDWELICIDPVLCEPTNQVFANQLKRGSQWLKDMGFERPASFSNLELGDPELTHWIAFISDKYVAEQNRDFSGFYEGATEKIWLVSDNYFSIGQPGLVHDHPIYQLGNLDTLVGVHELFHAVQNASEYHLPFTPEDRWIREGTAMAVQLDYASEIETDTEALYLTGHHTHPLDQPINSKDSYYTAGFWLFIGTHIKSKPRIAYLHQLLQNNLLEEGTGVKAVDSFLEPHGGMYRVFPLYMAQVPFQRSFGQPTKWQLKLPPNQKEITETFSGSVQRIAGAAGKLTIIHQAEQPVDIRIEFVGDDSDLHLIVDKRIQVSEHKPDHNVFTKQINGNKESFELVIAEVAKDVSASQNRNFSVKVTLKEQEPRPCGFKAEVGSGVPMAGYHEGPARMIGNLVILSDPKSGWEAHVEIPAKTTGTFKTTFQAAAIKVDHPECPGCVEYWESDDAQIQITAINNDRETGFVEGSFSGIAAWKGGGSTGNATPFSVKVNQFRALKYNVRKTGALQSCVDYWKNR